jgi:hypothetical protein
MNSSGAGNASHMSDEPGQDEPADQAAHQARVYTPRKDGLADERDNPQSRLADDATAEENAATSLDQPSETAE